MTAPYHQQAPFGTGQNDWCKGCFNQSDILHTSPHTNTHARQGSSMAREDRGGGGGGGGFRGPHVLSRMG